MHLRKPRSRYTLGLLLRAQARRALYGFREQAGPPGASCMHNSLANVPCAHARDHKLQARVPTLQSISARTSARTSSTAAISAVGCASVSASLRMPQNSVGRMLGLAARKRQPCVRGWGEQRTGQISLPAGCHTLQPYSYNKAI